MRLAEQLQPPALRIHEMLSGEAREARIQAVFARVMDETMAGKGDFWKDEHEEITEAIRSALGNAATFNENRWIQVQNAIYAEAVKYAHAVAEDTD